MEEIENIENTDELESDFIPESDEDNEGGMFEHFRFVADRGQSLLRVDKFITARIENTSRHRVQLAISAGFVKVNGIVTKANYCVKPLDIVTVEFPYRRRSLEIIPENIPLDIVYQDSDLMVINKPAGLVVHPGHGNYTGTLVNALAYYLGADSLRDGEDERMGVLVHRIDKDTSGLLLIAKNEYSQLFLAKQFADHTVEREYTALVWGNLDKEEGRIEGNIARDPNDRLRFKVFPEGNTGKHAVTHYKVTERFGYTTLVSCRLETGRTHQIRVHMDYIGHPLFNDSRYGGDRILKGTIYAKFRQFVDNCFSLMPRQALHARTIGFVHPSTKKRLLFESPLPQDFLSVTEKWRNYSKYSPN
ncbi:MAG: RluA family pseudouridine synthase [Bacteroidales bacterium]|nr:RluA family pseudouridine synthase [Bacteroidales bacterium]MDD3989306.1 RluA family pseudouridine synthase [Bacteroidales bacterium]